ncbi:pentapeptide repeat-containing protein [Frankia gtarii]|uniref:pentapeptide repeat-containing protein n=1 Tax=Frankia gtarii TaxID=2950102 RepID=UPI0027DF8B1A|nr:pentapeptide repeat-containing protein [Frankia gtarii]
MQQIGAWWRTTWIVANDGGHQQTGRRWLLIIAGIAVAGAVLAISGIWFLPGLMYSLRVSGGAQARAALQGGLLTASAALLAVSGALVALDETRRANAEVRRANANTHVRELYVRAIDQLGSKNDTVRLGGIYALERVANDSPADQRTVVEVLSAFIRMRSTDPALRRPPADDDPLPSLRPAADIRAAVQVLSRLPEQKDVPRCDLAGADLTGPASLSGLALPRARLAGAWLVGADLTDAQLEEADLTNAQLGRATLIGAQMERAVLSHAQMSEVDLTNAWLDNAILTRAQMDRAILTGAQLTQANLTDVQLGRATLIGAVLIEATLIDAALIRANFMGANLLRANLWGAALGRVNLRGARLNEANLAYTRLDGVDLTDAWLNGTDLTGARDLRQGQVDVAQGDERTRLPAGREKPASWTSNGGGS